MIASVHVADVGVPAGAQDPRKAPRRRVDRRTCATPNVAFAAPLGGSRHAVAAVRPRRAHRVLGRRRLARPIPLRRPARGQVRVGLARAARAAARARRLARPAERHSRSDRNVEHEGPVAALTLGRPRASQLIRFLRTSTKAENSAVGAPGLTWATGPALARCRSSRPARCGSRPARCRRTPTATGILRTPTRSPAARRSRSTTSRRSSASAPTVPTVGSTARTRSRRVGSHPSTRRPTTRILIKRDCAPQHGADSHQSSV